MIKRIKQQPPDELLDTKWDTVRKDALVRKNHHVVSDSCYRDCTIEDLLKIYEHKCAYCERVRGLEVNIDHYRPKKQRNKLTNTHYNQPGYYWLPYEWSNLLPLCSKCNQFKTNKFPLVGWNEANRISTPENPIGTIDIRRFSLAYLNSSENPLLLNPECEPLEFYDHFAFNEHGRIAHRTNKAQETIVLCNLNRRDLRRERRTMIFYYVGLIKEQIDEYLTKNKTNPIRDHLLEHGLEFVFKMIRNNINSDQQFTLLALYMFKYFDNIILPHISGRKSRHLVQTAFRKYKQNNP